MTDEDDKSPAEPAGPEDCQYVPDDEWRSAQSEIEAQRTGEDRTIFTPHDELSEAYRPTALVTPLADDGLPDQSRDPVGDGRAPPMTPETLVCMGWQRDEVVRRPCKFYKRQVFASTDQPDPRQWGHTVVHRMCTARRSNGGAFLSLNDQAVYACDLRDPPDHLSSGKQDEIDAIIIAKKRHLVMVSAFGLSDMDEYRLAEDPYVGVLDHVIKNQKELP